MAAMFGVNHSAVAVSLFSDFAEEMKPIFHEGSLFGDPPASTRNCVTQARKLMALRQAAKQITVTETPRHGGAS